MVRATAVEYVYLKVKLMDLCVEVGVPRKNKLVTFPETQNISKENNPGKTRTCSTISYLAKLALAPVSA